MKPLLLKKHPDQKLFILSGGELDLPVVFNDELSATIVQRAIKKARKRKKSISIDSPLPDFDISDSDWSALLDNVAKHENISFNRLVYKGKEYVRSLLFLVKFNLPTTVLNSLGREKFSTASQFRHRSYNWIRNGLLDVLAEAVVETGLFDKLGIAPVSRDSVVVMLFRIKLLEIRAGRLFSIRKLGNNYLTQGKIS